MFSRHLIPAALNYFRHAAGFGFFFFLPCFLPIEKHENNPFTPLPSPTFVIMIFVIMIMIVIMINFRHFRCASSKKKNLPIRLMTKLEGTDPDVPSHMKLIVIPTIRHAANLRLQRRTAPSRQCTQ